MLSLDIILQHKDVLQLLPDRPADSHKGNYGRILLLGGSIGYTGAPVLAAQGALRVGAGLVYLGVPRSIYPIVASKLDEPIVLPLPSFSGRLATFAARRIHAMLPGKNAVLIGPGLGQNSGTLAAVRTVLQTCECPVIVDADGINVLSKHKDILRDRTNPTILTPHPGEFARMVGSYRDRRTAAIEAAREWNSVVVLKGHQTLITDGVTCYQNQTGNPGMAVGGSGDVLAGMIAGLVGQGLKPLEAAAAAVWLHGAAGDRCSQQLGQYGMLPSDMLQVLPRLMK